MIEFLTAENIPLIDVHWKMKVVYGDDCADIWQHVPAMQTSDISA
jgi:hypothetical protein